MLCSRRNASVCVCMCTSSGQDGRKTHLAASGIPCYHFGACLPQSPARAMRLACHCVEATWCCCVGAHNRKRALQGEALTSRAFAAAAPSEQHRRLHIKGHRKMNCARPIGCHLSWPCPQLRPQICTWPEMPPIFLWGGSRLCGASHGSFW